MESESFVQSLEFVIDKIQSAIVKTAEERITYLFNVKVELRGVFAGSPKHQQWICVTGTENAVNKAKEYILALTSPAETIRMKNIWSHPLFTSQLEDTIERSSCAALSKYEDDGLVISGTELSVILAQSMIDDMFSKTSADITDKDMGRLDSRSTIPDSGIDMYCADHDFSAKENSKDELRGSASLNKNNSSLTSVVPPQSSSTSTGAAAHYTDGFLTSDPRSSLHKISTSTLYNPFSPSGSDVLHACSSTTHKKALTENNGNWHSAKDGKDLPLSSQRNGKTVTEQPSAVRKQFPHELIRNSMYASASAIYPRPSDTQMFVSTVPQLYSNCGAAQAKHACHTVNHAGDGAVTTVGLPANLQQTGLIGEVPMEVCSLGSSQRMGSTYLSPQAKDQLAYLRNLGQSLHYCNKDIEKGLACYSMDDVVRPSEFLTTLNKIKAQRHGGGQHQNTGTDYREIPNTSHTPTALAVSSKTVPTTATNVVSSEMPMHDYIDLDASVLCMGSFCDDNSTIVLSSDDEIDVPEESILNFPVPPNPPPHTHHYPTPGSSELQPTSKREPAVCMDREVTMNRDSVITVPQRPTGQKILRYIIIDGSNVAMSHGNNKIFSVEGLRICINYFVMRGHDSITAFVPEWRRYSENQTSLTGRALLEKLHDDGFIKFTPARRILGKTIASYDDRFILNLAEKEDGVVVSNDQFRDLCQERASYQNIVANRLLQFMFVGDHFMPPDDPLGRHGPLLDDFLRHPPQPQKPACNNSRRETQPLSADERLRVDLRQPLQRQPTRKDLELAKSQPVRSPTVTSELFVKLAQMFPEPGQAPHILKVLNNHKNETDLNRLTNYCMNALFR